MKVIDLSAVKYFRGNVSAFGFISGWKSNFYLFFPLISFLVHWKYRNMTIRFHENDMINAAIERDLASKGDSDHGNSRD